MKQKNEKILVFILFLVCLFLRLAYITQKNLWFDEVYSWHLSLDSFYTIIVRAANDIHPPLFYFILKFWTFFLGDSVTSMRLLSALFSSSAVFFLYLLSRRYLDVSNTMLVLLLYIVSPLNIYYSQEVRMAGMNLFWNIGSVYYLLKLMDKPHDFRRIFKDKNSIKFVIFTAAALYTHYFSFFILIAELAYIIYSYRKNAKQFIAFFLLISAIVLIYIPWIPELITHLSRGQSWRTAQTLSEVLNEYVNFSRDLNLGLYYHFTNLKLVNLITIFWGIVVLVSGFGLFLNKKTMDSPVLLLLILLITLILAGLISFRQKIEFYRYLSILVPFISFFMVYGLSNWNKKFIIYPFILILLTVNIYGVCINFSFNFKNNDYRALINKINIEYNLGERIYVEPHFNGWTINYYKKQSNLNLPDPVIIRYGWNEIVDSLNTQKPESFWLVMDYSAIDTTDYLTKIKSMMEKYTLIEMTTYFIAPAKVELYRFRNY